jgi:hypothetical protein
MIWDLLLGKVVESLYSHESFAYRLHRNTSTPPAMTATTNIETEAFVVDSPNAPFKLTPIILDEMREDEFLIEMKYSGICHTVSGELILCSLARC